MIKRPDGPKALHECSLLIAIFHEWSTLEIEIDAQSYTSQYDYCASYACNDVESIILARIDHVDGNTENELEGCLIEESERKIHHLDLPLDILDYTLSNEKNAPDAEE